VLPLVAATSAIVGASHGALPSTRSSCGSATPLRGSPILKLGPVMVAGFSSRRCAQITLECGGQGGYQSRLSLQLDQPPKSRIVLRTTAAPDPVKLVLVGSTTPAPKVPRCLSGRVARSTAFLEAPDQYFVLFVFASKDVVFHVTAWRGRHRLGAAVVAATRAR
jgi:hypothetical protein